MSEPRKLALADLRAIVSDGEELTKGARVFDDGGLMNLARFEAKLFADAKGSGTAPYRVSVTFGDVDVRARCTCMAARSRPFCKHAAALLVGWARAPESFAVSDAAPGGERGAAKKKSVKKGETDTKELMARGVEQVGALVKDLGVAGVAALSDDRVAPIKSLGEALRENKLRRLSARTLDLFLMLEKGAEDGAVDPIAYADLVTDLLLTARKLEKHLAGEALEPRHVEELVGKTWRKEDRKPVADVDLLEVAYFVRTTSDDFTIMESRLFDVASGTHYSEKKIVPNMMAKLAAKPSRGGALHAGARGTIYPTFAPLRLDLTDLGDTKPIDQPVLANVVERSLPDVGAALAAFQEHRKDVFAPPMLPAAVRVEMLLARGDRLQAVDANGNALHLPVDAALEERLGGALRDAKLRAIVGDVGLDAALPTLFPHAAVLEGPLGLELRLLAEPSAREDAHAIPASGWADAARAAGASRAAIALGEVREELAQAFVVGLATLSERAVEPLAARLGELGLGKQAELLRAIAKRPDADARIDDFLKLYQVLEIALVRLAGATQVDKSALERVPAYESVYVPKPARELTAREAAAERKASRINRYEAAVHYARHYDRMSPDELLANVYPIWADGSATPFVARALASRGDAAIAAAKRALAAEAGRTAKITAVHVLRAAGGKAAEEELARLATTSKDNGLRALAADARDALLLRHEDPMRVRARRAQQDRVAELANDLITAPHKDTRSEAADKLSTLGDLAAIPALRVAFFRDATRDVRKHAAHALALLGDTEIVDTLLVMLERRGESDDQAKVAAQALGMLGDARGLDAVIEAYAEGYKPPLLAEALRAFGPVALEPLLDRIEKEPKIAERPAAVRALESLGESELAKGLVARVDDAKRAGNLLERGALLLKLAGATPKSKRDVAEAIARALEGDADKEAKTLLKLAQKALK